MSGSKIFIFDHLKVKICDILPKQKNNAPNLLYVAKYIKIYQKINDKLGKYWGKSYSFWPWTLVSSIDFGMENKLCPKNLIPGFGHS